MHRAIIFDVDGTLLDTERIYMHAWQKAGASFGYAIPREVLLQTRAVSSSVSESLFLRACGPDFPYSRIRAERVIISERIIDSSPAHTLRMPYAQEILEWLKEQGYILAVASSTDLSKTRAHLEHAGLLNFFSAIVGGDMVENGKPQPDIFLEAAALCRVLPRHCLVVGDTPADVLGGTAAGMKVVLIPDQVPLDSQTSSLSWKVLSGLEQLKDTVARWEC